MRARVGKRTKAKKSVYLREVSPKLCKVARALVAKFCGRNRSRREGNRQCLGNSDV